MVTNGIIMRYTKPGRYTEVEPPAVLLKMIDFGKAIRAPTAADSEQATSGCADKGYVQGLRTLLDALELLRQYARRKRV